MRDFTTLHIKGTAEEFNEFLTTPVIILTCGQEYQSKGVVQALKAAIDSYFTSKMWALLVVSDASDCAEFYKGFAKDNREVLMELMRYNGVIEYELSEALLPPPTASLI